MPFIILASLILSAPSVFASETLLTCSTAKGNIVTSISEHSETASVTYYDETSELDQVIEIANTEFEELESKSIVDDFTNPVDCSRGKSWGTRIVTYTVRALLHLPESAPEFAEEVVGSQGKIYLCEQFSYWQQPCSQRVLTTTGY